LQKIETKLKKIVNVTTLQNIKIKLRKWSMWQHFETKWLMWEYCQISK